MLRLLMSELTKSAFGLVGEVALITGGGTGLGRGMAHCMVESGARVVLVGRREEPLRETAAALGDQVTYRVHDVTDTARAPELVADLAGREGAPSILVNNAGIHIKQAAADMPEEDMRRILETHVVGATALARAIVPGMFSAGRGSILFITSMAAVFGIPKVAAYSAAKAAMLGLVRSLAVEWSPEGVRVNAIAPGWIDSPMMRKALDNDPDRKNRILGRTPLKGFGQPEDIGRAAVYLCSRAGRFVSGQQLVVDGGASIGF